MDQARYDHRQSTVVFLALLALVIAATAVPAVLDGGALAVIGVLAVGAVVLALLLAFSQLRTTVTGSRIRVAFRFGWPAREIPLASVVGHRPVRNRWWWGFGIRLVPGGGWMYNVWGLDAVEVRYRGDRGERRFLIGTDDPDGLDAAIAGGISGSRHR